MNENIRVIADKEDIVAIADAVREKLGSTVEMSLGEIVTNINKIGTVDLDAEVTAQENIITSQDALIASITSALEGKAAGGSSGVNLVTTTITDAQADWVESVTIPELVGAKYFIIQGNPLTGSQVSNLTKMDDAGTIYQLIYLNGIKITTYFTALGSSSNSAFFTISYDPICFDFDETTGTIESTGSPNSYSLMFHRPTVDTTEGDTVYTVYRLG